MYYHNDLVSIEEDDQCYTCTHFNKGLACPLLHALSAGSVFMDEELIVTGCGFYTEFVRHLRVVKDD